MISPENDRILPATRGLAVFIIPFLVAAFLILYLSPDTNGDRFAWAVKPRISSMFLGATYLSGVVYFVTLALGRSWRQTRMGLLPVTTFASLMAIATILHWDRFNHDHPAFWLWSGLYFTTPFLVFSAWYWNNRVNPAETPPGEMVVPRPVQAAIGLASLAGLAGAVGLFLVPDLFIGVWPWLLSPLTARVTAGEWALFAMFGMLAAREGYWSSVARLLRFQLSVPLLFLAAALISRDDLRWGNPVTWVFLATLVMVFVLGIPALFTYLESRRRRQLAGDL
jgi:hypothetical protein